jgi:hypothetical protein
MTDIKAEITEYHGDEIAQEVISDVGKILSDTSKVIGKSAQDNLSTIESSTKWQRPGGYGYWAVQKPHGFMRESISAGQYESKKGSAGGWVNLSSLFYPIERGTTKGKRGWGARGGDEYMTGYSSGKGYMENARRGPSKAQPFLDPAIQEHEDEIWAALDAIKRG